MRLRLKYLFIELTRKCNMSCKHCLRGKSENKAISYEVLSRLLANVAEIGQLTLTGGEPSLASRELDYLVYCLRKYGVQVKSFVCYVNGAKHNPEFISALEKLYSLCKEKEQCKLGISRDGFHGETDRNAVDALSALPFFRSFVPENDGLQGNQIYNEGLARENGIGHFDFTVPECFYDVKYEGCITVSNFVYCNADGDIVFSPDLSYENQKKRIAGNVLTEELDTIIVRNMYRYKDDRGTHVYRVKITTDGLTKLTDDKAAFYYSDEAFAADAFLRLLNNLRCCNNALIKEIAKQDIYSEYEELIKDKKENPEFVRGGIITYRLSDGTVSAKLLISLEKYRLEDSYEQH